MRILCVTSSFPLHPTDHSGRFVQDLNRAFTAAGDEVDVLAPDAPAAPPNRDFGVERVTYFLPRRSQRLFYGRGAPENLASDPLARLQVAPAVLALAVATAVRARAADVILAHWLVPAGLAAALASMLGGPPLVVVAHSSDVHILKKLPGGRLLGRWIAARAAAVCAVAGDVSRRLEELGVEARTLPLGVSLAPAAISRPQARARLGLGGRTAIVSVGRLEPIKGHDLLLEAVRDWRGATVIIAGDGSLREPLAARARELGVDLRLPGVLGPDALGELFAAADVAAFPSRRLADGRSEGLPVSLLESLAAGLPVVAASVGAIPEALRGAGLLVAPDDASALATALREAAADCGAFRERARKRAERYDLPAAAERYRRLFQEVV